MHAWEIEWIVWIQQQGGPALDRFFGVYTNFGGSYYLYLIPLVLWCVDYRMGLRLRGAKLKHSSMGFNISSDGIATGGIQVPGNGLPIVLLADHHTTGGYPKIATVISYDTDRLAQFRAGQSLRFTSISSQQAVDDVRTFMTQKIQYLEQISVPRGSLAQRLMRENLIHGCVFD